MIKCLISVPFKVMSFSDVKRTNIYRLPSLVRFKMRFRPSSYITLKVLFTVGSVRTVNSCSTAAVKTVSEAPGSSRLRHKVINCNLSGIMNTLLNKLPATACDRGINVIAAAGIVGH